MKNQITLPAYLIDEANNFAQDAATKFLESVDEDATLEVYDGECYVKSENPISEYLIENVQDVYDKNFVSKCKKLSKQIN